MKKELDPELRDELLRLAMETDVVASRRVEPWREACVCAARWLLRTAALADRAPSAPFRALAAALDRSKALPDEVEREKRQLMKMLEDQGLAKQPS